MTYKMAAGGPVVSHGFILLFKCEWTGSHKKWSMNAGGSLPKGALIIIIIIIMNNFSIALFPVKKKKLNALNSKCTTDE